jgi:hypothetical protein
MTGLFAGTRLAEFSSGMGLAFLFVNSERFHTFWENRQQVAFLSLLIYLAGLFLSFTLAGSIVSNLLVTIGLTGITVSIWRAISSNVFSGLRNLILWIGSISLSVSVASRTLNGLPFLFRDKTRRSGFAGYRFFLPSCGGI